MAQWLVLAVSKCVHPYIQVLSIRGGSCGRTAGIPETLDWRRIILNIIQSVQFAKSPKSAFQVINDGPRSEGFGSISSKTWTEMNVMVDDRLFLFCVGKIGFLYDRVSQSANLHFGMI